MPKKAQSIQKVAAQSLIANDALSYPIKRAKVARRHVDKIVPTRGRSAFGHLTPNWIGAGMMTQTLRAIFTSEEPQFVEARERMKDRGFKKRPQELDFDIVALIEGSFPELTATDDLARRLNRTHAEIQARLAYLREFMALMCGINLLRDGKGKVGIADAGLWMEWQNRMARIANGVRESQERHGLNLQTVVKQKLTVTEELPSIQPMIFGFKPDEGEAGAAVNV